MKTLAVLATLCLTMACARSPEDATTSDGGDGRPAPADAGTIGDPDVDAGTPVTGCQGGNGSANQPFGNHQQAYASGAIMPAVDRGERDDAVRSFYDYWRATYVRAGCGAGRYYVAVGFDDSITVSEAHGYGMIAVAYMAGYDGDAKTIFDGMYRFFLDHPSEGSSDLMAWSQNAACQSNRGAHSASDGDLDIAYALLLADKQWGSGGAIDYRAEAHRVIDAILRDDVDSTDSWILLGDWTSAGSSHYDATRSSDFMPGHLASFAAATGDGVWNQVTDRLYSTFAAIQSSYAPGTGLVPDFILDPAGAPRPAEAYFLERPVDGAYSFNACRVPWRLAVHYLTSGDNRARNALRPLNDWIKARSGGNPYAITAGYWLDGDSLPGSSYFDLAFAAPFAVGAMVDGANQAWLDALWWAVADQDPANYYSDSLKLLSMLVMSGNWWSPESAPCGA